jgi:hypothetical protein
MAVSRLNQSPAATSELGTPIRPGFPWGRISTAGDSGHAELSFSATGPKAHGTVYVDATKSGGRWQLTRLDLVVADSGRRLDLRGGGGVPKPSPSRPNARTPVPEPSGK